MHRVVIIADDLTGALDTAAPFAERGLRTYAVALPEATPQEGGSALLGAHVVAINTESRHLSPELAAEAVARAVQRYGRPGDVVFKKVDSTLRGNVAVEVLAALRASGRSRALIAPAFPAQGRVMREGVVYVHGVPLAQTEFVRDALSPAPREPLPVVMQRAAPEALAKRIAAHELSAQIDAAPSTTSRQERLLIVDAQSQHDLDRVVAGAGERVNELVLVGSAGLATALVDALAAGDLRGESPGTVERQVARAGPMLFVIGSRAQKSREQAERLRAQPDTVCIEAPNGEVSDVVLESALTTVGANGKVLLLATQAAPGIDAGADTVARRLAQACVRLLPRLRPKAITATGGDTARALLELTRNSVIEVRGELLPGIALARIVVDSQEYMFVTKAGGFGQVDTLLGISKMLP